MLDFSDKKFKIIMINTLNDLMKKVDTMQYWMDDVSRDLGTIRKKWKGNPEIKKIKNHWNRNKECP